MAKAFVFRGPQEDPFVLTIPDLGRSITMVIGRDPACDVIIPYRFETVSRRHARLSRVDDECWVEDLGAKNLTWVNDRVVPFSCRVAFPLDLQLGSLPVRVDYIDVDMDVAADIDSTVSEQVAWEPPATAKIGELDWRKIVESLELSAGWSLALFDLAEVVAQGNSYTRTLGSLQRVMRHHLQAERLQLCLESTSAAGLAQLTRFNLDKFRDKVLELGPNSPSLFEVDPESRLAVWGQYQPGESASPVALVAAQLSEGAIARLSTSEARWYALLALQLAVPTLDRLRRLNSLEIMALIPTAKIPDETTVKVANELGLWGCSKAHLECLYSAQIAAQAYFELQTRDSGLKVVTILGEIGSGKSALAKLVHRLSSRRDKKFCHFDAAGGIVPTLAESILFGVKGRVAREPERPGFFEVANDNTLFLDELGHLDLVIQSKLLVVLSESVYYRVGEPNIARRTNAYVIVGANQDLEGMCRVGKFLPDLLSRIQRFIIKVPPLRERKEDIPLLIDHELASLRERNAKGNLAIQKVSDELLGAMMAYHWPENVRELLLMIQGAAVFAPPGCKILGMEHLQSNHRNRLMGARPAVLQGHCDTSLSWKENVFALRREYIARLLGECGGRFEVMRARAGVARDTLKKWELELKTYLAGADEREMARIQALTGDGWWRVAPDLDAIDDD